jgi:hypothetical protein
LLTLAQVLGKGGDEAVKAIAKSGQLVFHAAGDTGSVCGPDNISKVADKMVADFDEEATQNAPRFFFHLGDVIYNFGEAQYYYDQFYEPYREYAGTSAVTLLRLRIRDPARGRRSLAHRADSARGVL